MVKVARAMAGPLVLAVLSLAPAAAAGPPYAGRPLEEVLLDLSAAADLRLVFTTQVVTPSMKVEAEPSAREPRAVLDDLLRPHGLRAVDGPAGALMVVPGPPPEPVAGTVAGTVRHRQTGALLEGVVVGERGGGRSVTGGDGRFRLELGPGSRTLEIRRGGLVPQEVTLTVIAGQSQEVDVVLAPVPTTVEEIDVGTSRWSLLGEGPSTLVLDSSRLRSLPSLAADPYRGLTLFPGTTGNDISSRFNVRGGLSSEVTVRIDGVEVLEPFHLQDYGGAFSILDPAAIDNVELKRGGYRADYGERRGGVVEMTTITPSRPRTQLGLSWLSLELARGDVLGGGRGSYFGSLRLGSLQPAFEITEQPENPSFGDAFLKLERHLGDGRSLLGYVLHSRNHLDFTDGDEDGGEGRTFATDYVNTYAWIDYQTLLGGDRFVETRLAASRLERDRAGAERDGSSDVRLRDRRRLDLIDFAHSWSWRRGDHLQLRAGLEARRLEAHFDYFDERSFDDPLAELRPGSADGSTVFVDSLRGEQLAVWSSADFDLARGLDLELGVRFDDNRLTGESYLSPRFNLSYRAGGRGVLRLAWGLFRQSQRPDELQVADGESGLFDAERAEQRILGYERDFGGPASLVLRAEAYEYLIRDPHPRHENLFQPLSFLPEVEADRVRLVPSGGRSRGIELFLRGRAGRRLDGWLGVTWSEVRDRIDGRDVPRSVDQPWSAQLGLAWRSPWRWDFQLAWRWHAGWPTTAVAGALETTAAGETRIVPVLGPLFGERLPDYNRLDLRASRPFRLAHGELELYVEVQNLFDENNTAGFEVDFVRTADGVATVKESKSWVGVLPLAGVRWRF